MNIFLDFLFVMMYISVFLGMSLDCLILVFMWVEYGGDIFVVMVNEVNVNWFILFCFFVF